MANIVVIGDTIVTQVDLDNELEQPGFSNFQPKYSVGDSVIINHNIANKKYYNTLSSDRVFSKIGRGLYFTGAMMEYIGCNTKISEIVGAYPNYKYKIEDDKGKWLWTDEMFESN